MPKKKCHNCGSENIEIEVINKKKKSGTSHMPFGYVVCQKCGAKRVDRN